MKVLKTGSYKTYNNTVFHSRKNLYAPVKKIVDKYETITTADKKLEKLNDRYSAEIKDKLGYMLDFAGNNSPIKLSDTGFLRRVLPFLSRNGIIESYMDKFKDIGKTAFYNDNYTLFKGLIEDEKNMDVSGYVNFRADSDIIRNKPYTDIRTLAPNLSDKIVHGLYKIGYYNGALSFINEHSSFFKEVLKSIKDNNTEAAALNVLNKDNMPQRFEETLKEYRRIVNSIGEFPSNGTEEQKQNWHKLDDEKRKLYGILKENNVSIVEKTEFSTDPNVDIEDKKKYLIWLSQFAYFNKASQLDIIEEYEKYFFRFWVYDDNTHSSIRELSSVYKLNGDDIEYNKMVFDRYLTMMEKFAQNDPDGMRDAEIFSFAIETYYSNVLDENSALRAIEILKKIAFQQIDAYIVELETNRLNSEKVNNAMKELNEIVKNMPYERKKVR